MTTEEPTYSNNDDRMLERINQWALAHSKTKGVILTGSRASKFDLVDPLSDYDLAVVVDDISFIKTDEWITNINPFLVCIHDSFSLSETEIPTRLIIFENRTKVDFSFYSLENFDAVFSKDKLPDGFDNGYTVLVDKEANLNKLPEPTFKAFIVKAPTEQEYTNNENEFWFEVYHVAKYLARNDLWVAHLRDWAVKKFLLQMIAWHHSIISEVDLRIRLDGKSIRCWLDKATHDKLNCCFGKLDRKSAEQALQNTIRLYRETGRNVSQKLLYKYNQKLDDAISAFIGNLIQTQ